MALPSLTAIKCTVIDNKTANINDDENCSLFTVLTATHQKLQKSLKCDITQHHVDISAMWWWVMSPFYDFYSF